MITLRSLGKRLALLALCAAPALAGAEGIIDIRPYVTATATYDDNVFRISDRTQARATLGSEAMSDWSRRTEAGVDVDWKISRQHLRAGWHFNRNRYDRFDFLDHDGYSKSLAWDWHVGSHLGGELSMNESRSMSGFTEIRNPVLNERTVRRRLASANWDLHPRWRLHVQRDEAEYENSLPSYRSSDRKDVGHEASVRYATPEGDTIGLSLREVESSYSSRDAFSTLVFGNGNRQRDLALNLAWNVTGMTRLGARLARVERQYDELSERDMQAWAGRLSVDWQPTGKTALSVSAVRDVYGVDDIAATYVQSDALSLSPTWRPTAKLLLQARASYEKRSYQGDPGFLLGVLPQREDTLKTAGLTVSYTPHEKVQMQLSWQKESRDSSVAGGGYDTDALSANLRVDF